MAVNPKAAPGQLLKNTAAAPMIHYDGVPVFGTQKNIVEIELSARVLLPKPDGSVQADLVCVAHLRGSLAAATYLRDALDKALAMASTQGEAKH